MAQAFRLLREALLQLSLEPDEQRAHLAGTVVTDELVLDLDHAIGCLNHTQDVEGISLDAAVVDDVRGLLALLDVQPGDELWDDAALDRHPIWAEARLRARSILPNVPTWTSDA